jgi:hypothetical protein
LIRRQVLEGGKSGKDAVSIPTEAMFSRSKPEVSFRIQAEAVKIKARQPVFESERLLDVAIRSDLDQALSGDGAPDISRTVFHDAANNPALPH